MSDWQPDPSIPLHVVCAAIRTMPGGLIICGARHYDDIMRSMINQCGGRDAWLGCEQGFIDQFGRFMTREEAWIAAEKAGQIKREVSSPWTLYSENLY